jgi:hypothetical protein
VSTAKIQLSPQPRDVRRLDARRRFTLTGAPGTTVAFAYASAAGASALSRVKAPRAPSFVPPTDPPYDLMLEVKGDGLPVSIGPVFEPSSFLCYVLLQGTVTSCTVEADEKVEDLPAVEVELRDDSQVQRQLAELEGTRLRTLTADAFRRSASETLPLVDARGANIDTRGAR